MIQSLLSFLPVAEDLLGDEGVDLYDLVDLLAVGAVQRRRQAEGSTPKSSAERRLKRL